MTAHWKAIKRAIRDLKTKIEARLARTTLPSRTIRFIERRRGIRYPHGLIGRRNIPLADGKRADVLVIAAHPDDEALGVGLTLAKHRARGDSVMVVFTTNGSGGDWRARNEDQESLAAIRLAEARGALGVIGIGSEDIVTLGFPDGGLHRYIVEAAQDIAGILNACAPKRVYVHAIEGGHVDHDVTGFIGQTVCARLGVDSVFEWAEYNRENRCGALKSEARFAFDPYAGDCSPVSTPFTREEAKIKAEMLSKYGSQAVAIEGYPFRDEILRHANPVHLVARLAHFRALPERTVHALVRGVSGLAPLRARKVGALASRATGAISE